MEDSKNSSSNQHDEQSLAVWMYTKVPYDNLRHWEHQSRLTCPNIGVCEYLMHLLSCCGPSELRQYKIPSDSLGGNCMYLTHSFCSRFPQWKPHYAIKRSTGVSESEDISESCNHIVAVREDKLCFCVFELAGYNSTCLTIMKDEVTTSEADGFGERYEYERRNNHLLKRSAKDGSIKCIINLEYTNELKYEKNFRTNVDESHSKCFTFRYKDGPYIIALSVSQENSKIIMSIRTAFKKGLIYKRHPQKLGITHSIECTENRNGMTTAASKIIVDHFSKKPASIFVQDHLPKHFQIDDIVLAVQSYIHQLPQH